VATIYLLISVFGFGQLARFGNDYHNYNICPKINLVIQQLVAKLEGYKEVKEDLNFHFGLENIKCITSSSFQADVKLVATDSTDKTVFESKKINNVELFVLQGLNNPDILTQAFSPNQKFSRLIYLVQVAQDQNLDQVISYKPETYRANVEPNGGMGYDLFNFIDIGCQKQAQEIVRSDPVNPNLITTTKLHNFEYRKKIGDEIFKCY
jgi:hypothetical protein